MEIKACLGPGITIGGYFLQINELSHEVTKLKAVILDRESAFPAGQVDSTDEELSDLRAQLLAAKQEYKECNTRWATTLAPVLEPTAAS